MYFDFRTWLRIAVLIVREPLDRTGFFICTDGTSRSMQAVRRAAVLAHTAGQPITLFSAADHEAGIKAAVAAATSERASTRRFAVYALGGVHTATHEEALDTLVSLWSTTAVGT